MRFTIIITASAQADIQWFKAFEQRIIVTAIRTYLQNSADVESNRRKQLRPNLIASWELKEGVYRVFYAIEAQQVTILAVGHKEHNQLYIRGQKVTL
jgi:mRNA-degrading endonuclease RelE of RelBE toxin-antitoxin system